MPCYKNGTNIKKIYKLTHFHVQKCVIRIFENYLDVLQDWLIAQIQFSKSNAHSTSGCTCIYKDVS